MEPWSGAADEEGRGMIATVDLYDDAHRPRSPGADLWQRIDGIPQALAPDEF